MPQKRTHTRAEEDHLKAIFALSSGSDEPVSTNAIAGKLETSPASVTDMIKKLADQKLITYRKYKGVRLTKRGKQMAINLIRNHRLWELFLVEKLNFKWDEVHDLAEQLEHINSEQLTDRLEEFLDHPKFDPHGDPIPDKDGNITPHQERSIADLKTGEAGLVVAVLDHQDSFLRFLSNSNIKLGAEIKVEGIEPYDRSMYLIVGGKKTMLSEKVCRNILVKKKP